MEKRTLYWLIAIFLVVLALRLFLVFETEQINYEGYSVIRNVENIRESGVPLFRDDLSYSGRTKVFSPLFAYLLTLFSFIPVSFIFIVKIVPNIFISLTIFIVFFIALYMTKNETASLVSAALSGFIPVLFIGTLNNISIYSLIIPLFFLTCYFFLVSVRDPEKTNIYLILLILLAILSPISILFVLGLLIYMFLIKIQNFRKNMKETELVLFSVFFVLWVNMTLYKKALLVHGSSIVYQNRPVQLIFESFKEITPLESMYSIGLVTLVFGLFSIYSAFFASNKKSVSFMISISLAVFFLLWFKLIALVPGLMLLGVLMSIIASHSINNNYSYYKNIKIKHFDKFFLVIIIILGLFFFSLSLNNIRENASVVPSNNDIVGFYWLKNNTLEDAVVLVLPEEGSAMSYFSSRKNVMDDNFLMVQNIDLRYKEVNQIYKDIFITQALEKLNYYSVDYIFLSEHNQKVNLIEDLRYFDDSCVVKIYPEDSYLKNVDTNVIYPKIYNVRCVIVLQKMGGLI